MPGKVKVRVLAGRNLPVMDRSSDTTDAYVEVKLGSTTYKTDVCRKSLHPQWDSDWFRYEVDDSELQDEPLQIRLMDHDTYSANDAIGKVYVDLNPLLLPPTSASGATSHQHSNTSNSDATHPNVQSVPGGTSGGGAMMSGWVPVFDTMHGIRGEVNLVVKVELFSDFNKFRQSSCGVQFFYSGSIPEGHVVSRLQGLVGDLVVEGDPEHQWIDKIRTPRASNEARQALFFKLSGELRRRIGLKAIELGANAVLGYQQSFDLEGETGIVVRGIGTAATLAKLQAPQNVQLQHHSPSPSPSPSPAGQLINTNNQGPLDISSNSHNHNSSPQVTASPRSRRRSQFQFFPSSPGSPRRYLSYSVSQSGFCAGASNSNTKPGSQNHLSVTGYGVVRCCPSAESIQTSSVEVESIKTCGESSKSANEMEDGEGNEFGSCEYRSKKKRGSFSERCSFVDRLKAVKLLPKTVHGKLSRLWSNSGGSSEQMPPTNSYKRSVSDNVGISVPNVDILTKSDPALGRNEFDPKPISIISKSEKEEILSVKPFSYPGSTFQSLTPVEITIQSPGEDRDIGEIFNAGNYSNIKDLGKCSEDTDVILSNECQRVLESSDSSKSLLFTSCYSTHENLVFQHQTLDGTTDLELKDKLEVIDNVKDQRDDIMVAEANAPDDVLLDESKMSKTIWNSSSTNISPENLSGLKDENVPPSVNSLNAIEDIGVSFQEEVPYSIEIKGNKSHQSNASFNNKSIPITSNEKQNISDVREDGHTVTSVLTICLKSSAKESKTKRRTVSLQKEDEYYDNSVGTSQLEFHDCKEKQLNYPIKNTKSDSCISEMAKESARLDSHRDTCNMTDAMYCDNIIAQVCQLDELITQRNSQSPRVRQFSRNYDDEDLHQECDIKAPMLEVSSWQEEENIEREENRSELTYVDGHLYSNLSSSDEDDDSSSCLSYVGDRKMDDDLLDYEKSRTSKTKSFLNTLAPKKLVKGYKKKKLSLGKRTLSQEKEASLNSKSPTSSGEKSMLNKAIIKDVQQKLLPIKIKKCVKDKTVKKSDSQDSETKKSSSDSLGSPLDSNCPSWSLASFSITKEENFNPSVPLMSNVDEQMPSEVSSSDVLVVNDDLRNISQIADFAEENANMRSTDLHDMKSFSPEPSENDGMTQENDIPAVRPVQTTPPSQAVSSKNKSSGMPELCAGNTPLPIHASPSSSTSSTSTLQCLCRTPVPGSTIPEKQGSSPASTDSQIKKNAGSTTDSHPCLHRRSSDSDLSVTPKGTPLGNSPVSGSSGGVGGSSRDSTGNSSQWYHHSGSYPAGGYHYHPYHGHGGHWGAHHLPHLHHPLMGRVPGGGANSGIAPDPLDMAEYPFLTMTSYPPGFILHLAGTVSARSVKLLSSGGDGGGGSGGGDEEAWEQRDAWWAEVRMEIRSHARALACDVVIAYSEKTSICDDVCVLSASGTAAVINPNYFYHGVGPEDGLRGVGTSHQYQGPRELMTSSLDRTDFEKEKVTLVASTTRVRNPSESRDTVDEKGVVGSVGGTASSASPPSNPTPIPPAATQHCTSGSIHLPSCSICHIPYGPSTVPFRINMAKCALCRRGCVPDVLLATCEPPEGLATIGVGSLIQAYASRGRRGEGGYGVGGSGGGGGMGGGGVVGVGVSSSGSTRGEVSAKDISDGLPFLEYDLHRALANKLRLCGMNAVFGLKVEVKVGERLLVAIASGTGILVSALPRPTVPCIRTQSVHQGGQISGSQIALADALQRNLEETVKRCKDTFLLDPPKDNSWTNGTGRSGNSDTDDSGEDEHQHSLPQLDLSAGNKDTCVLEVDDDEDAEAIALLVAGPPLPPKGFHIAATERVPGLCYCPNPSSSTLSPSQSCQTPTCFACLRPPPLADPKAPLRVVRNLQMFSQIWRAKLSPPPSGSVVGQNYGSTTSALSGTSSVSQTAHSAQGTSSTSLSLGPPSTITLHFNRLLQSIFFKLRKMAPCALANLTFRVDLPEPEEVQLYVVGMALGLGERLPRRQRFHTSGGGSRESARKADDSEMIFSLEEEEEAALKDENLPPETSTPKVTSVPSAKGWIPFMKGGGPRWAQWPLLGERHGIEVTPLSYIPGGRIQRYLGNLNFFFIRESTCIRESGGLSGFVHSFMSEVLCIVRAHARALGGNALVAFSTAECVLLHNPHKNQGQSLINVSGDVVYASYEQE